MLWWLRDDLARGGVALWSSDKINLDLTDAGARIINGDANALLM